MIGRNGLNFVRTATRFKSVERRDLRGFQIAEIVTVTGKMRIQGERIRTGEAFQSTSFVSQLGRLAIDGSWRVRLFQSTKIDDALWNAAAVDIAVAMAHRRGAQFTSATN